MKKRYLLTLLAAMTAATLAFAACGSSEEAEVATETTVEESIEASVEESTEASVESTEEAAEPVTYEVCITSLSDDEAMGYTADGTLYLFDLTGVSDEEKALFEEGAVLDITDDGSEVTETTITVDGADQTAIVAVATTAVSVDEEAAAEVKTEMYASVYGYTVEEQESATKYVSQAMTVYVGADEAADELGTLSAADEVTVTGTTDNGWTQIEYEGETAYIGSESVVDEKPEAQEASTGSNTTENTGASTETSTSTTTDAEAAQAAGEGPSKITVGDKTLYAFRNDRSTFTDQGVTPDSSKYIYGWVTNAGDGDGESTIYYYQLTYDEMMNPSNITDLDSHLIAVQNLKV